MTSAMMDHHAKELLNVWGGHLVTGGKPFALNDNKPSMFVVTNNVSPEVTSTACTLRRSVAK